MILKLQSFLPLFVDILQTACSLHSETSNSGRSQKSFLLVCISPPTSCKRHNFNKMLSNTMLKLIMLLTIQINPIVFLELPVRVGCMAIRLPASATHSQATEGNISALTGQGELFISEEFKQTWVH